jgi:hypothetical protein
MEEEDLTINAAAPLVRVASYGVLLSRNHLSPVCGAVDDNGARVGDDAIRERWHTSVEPSIGWPRST